MNKTLKEIHDEQAKATHTKVKKGGEQKADFRKLKNGKVMITYYTMEYGVWIDKGSIIKPVEIARKLWKEV